VKGEWRGAGRAELVGGRVVVCASRAADSGEIVVLDAGRRDAMFPQDGVIGISLVDAVPAGQRCPATDRAYNVRHCNRGRRPSSPPVNHPVGEF
jgi:hypothetical protein